MQIHNDEVAAALERIADLLEAQDAQPYRVRAYRTAAGTLRQLAPPVAELDAREGRPGLEKLPGVGKSIASLLHEFLRTGRIALLERLEGEVSPEALLATLPGIGEELAARIHGELGIDTLEELERAAHDGRLEGLGGFGPRRVRLVRDELAAVLGRSARLRSRRIEAAREGGSTAHESPGVDVLLAVDEEYRRRAAAGALRRIAPRRFNPEGRAWLPVLHVERDGWSFHVLFSNTARAHQLGTTRDWVIQYWERDGEEGQCTVVTEPRGPLAGRRVVRGREAECQRHYTREGATLPAGAGTL
jgi:hypothetical protein